MQSLEQALTAARGGLKTSESEAVQEFTLPPDFPGFDGHFPGRPLLPAFVQTLMGRHVLQQWLNAPCKVREVDRAKFKQPIGPETVTVRCKRLDRGYLVQLETQQGLAASFLLYCEPQAGGDAA